MHGSERVTTDQGGKPRPEGRITRSFSEILQIVQALLARREPIKVHLGDGVPLFVSRLRHVDPVGQYLIIEPSPEEAANAELLSRPRCTFFTEPTGWHLEFVASEPQKVVHDGVSAIRVGFPEVLSNLQQRTDARVPGSPTIRLHCIADEGGVISFEGWIVDISLAGIGFLIYDRNITLEPGAVLSRCLIEADAMTPLVVDLEVRYSEFVSLPDGTSAKRSGCRFVKLPDALREIINRFLGSSAA